MLTPSNPKVTIHDTKGAELNRILYLVQQQLHYLTLFPEEKSWLSFFSTFSCICHSGCVIVNKTVFYQFISSGLKLLK